MILHNIFYILSFVLHGIYSSSAAVATSDRRTTNVTKYCEFYNETMCNESRVQGGENGCNGREDCPTHGSEKRSHCYVLWKRDKEGKTSIQLKGCFLNNIDCYNKEKCVDTAYEPKKNLSFCCCEGDMCNQNFTWDPAPTTTTHNPIVVEPPPPNVIIIISYVCIGLLLLLLVVFGAYWFYDNRKSSLFNELPTSEPHPMPPPSPYMGMRPIQLQEIKARGRFGAVWKAQFKTKEVAVKIFPIQSIKVNPYLRAAQFKAR